MKQSWKLSARDIITGFAAWLVATNALVGLAYYTNWWLCKVLLFVCISFLPGVALLRTMRIVLRNFSVGLLYSFGLSLLVLILSGLAANELLHLVHVARPLELPGILGAWNITALVIITVGAYTNKQPLNIKRPFAGGFPRSAKIFLALTFLLPGLATLGAFQLNNGGHALLAELTLCVAAALIVYAFLLRQKLPDGVLLWFVFMLSLAVLLMTSLRGWDITGHDIEREFRVYTLTHSQGYWNIAADREPYNACLSITILPEMFAKLLNMSGLVVFKLILQVIFAACPGVIFVLLRQYASKLGALVGSMLFICYPTLINDSAMLTRQGVAYLFFALALLVVSNRTQQKRHKLLFLLCSAGVVLSHYSTAYMFVGLFALALVCKLGVLWRRRRNKTTQPETRPTVLSPWFAALIILMTFVWYAQITATSAGLVTTFRASFANIPRLFSNEDRSSDTSAALVFAGGQSQANLYESYVEGSQAKQISRVVNAAHYLPALTSDEMPLTPLGKKAVAVGLGPSLITTLRQNFAKVLQLLALAGVVYAAYRLFRKQSDVLDIDFICLNIAGLVLLGLMVLLPVLSINYGVLRAFQQTLIFLVLPITLLLARIGQLLSARLRLGIATLGIVLLFLLFTGVFSQVLGGTSPTLSLDNSGIYYGLYYSTAADASSFTWMKNHIEKGSDVRAANFNRAAMHDPRYPFAGVGILPSQIGPATYVYLDPAQVQTQKLYTYFRSSPLALQISPDYYTLAKNQIYSTTTTGVYK